LTTSEDKKLKAFYTPKLREAQNKRALLDFQKSDIMIKNLIRLEKELVIAQLLNSR
jgi:hypothetical protein